MPYSVKIPWETRLAEASEAEIKSRLSYFSTATKYSIDVGIDFYCELIEDDSPVVPFYVQAKGTEHFDASWGAAVKKSTIVYWINCSHPVFLIVHDEETGNCYWMSIEDQRNNLIQKILKTDSETVYIKMDTSHILEKGKNKNNEFIKKIKADIASVQLFQGWPSFKGEGYLKLVPDAPRSQMELQRVTENARKVLYSLLIHYFFVQGDLKNAYLLGEFLTKFDKSHYNHFVWFGQINMELGKKEEAKESFEDAIRILQNDKNWPPESKESIIARIKEDIENCK